jgi:hypothetical protein
MGIEGEDMKAKGIENIFIKIGADKVAQAENIFIKIIPEKAPKSWERDGCSGTGGF